jgi:hypothetical protein
MSILHGAFVKPWVSIRTSPMSQYVANAEQATVSDHVQRMVADDDTNVRRMGIDQLPRRANSKGNRRVSRECRA